MAGIARFKEGDLVWAKMKGHPHWPAQVSRGDGVCLVCSY